VTRCRQRLSECVATNRRAVNKQPASKSVFINCPFDDEFRPIFRAVVFTVILSGYHPRCALDSTDGAEVRVSKIAKLIGDCDWGIHDLSRVKPGAKSLPRFNMPMELGVHLGARLLGDRQHRRKRALILDAKPHRYDAFLSDISGQDIEAHANRPTQAMRHVRNWLSEHRAQTEPPLPGIDAVTQDYRTFNKEVGKLLAARRLDPLDSLTHNDFVFAVRDWIASRGNIAT
jgi:hypothetical protein